MKKISQDDSVGRSRHINIRTLCLRTLSVMVGVIVITSFIPFFTLGSEQDIVLQVPPVNVADPTDYVAIELDVDTLSNRSESYSTLTADINYDSAPAQNDNPDLISNTFQISERYTSEGVPDEIIALSEFELDYSTMYISVSEANVRSGPTTDSEVIAQITYSDVVVRVGIGSSWSRIQMDDLTEGYVLSVFLSSDYIAPPTPTPTPTPTPMPSYSESSISGRYYASATVNVRSGPGTEYELLRTLSAGDPVDVVSVTSNGWYRTARDTYVLASLVTSSPPQSSNTGGSSSGNNSSTVVVTPADPGSSDLATYAQSFIGVPYSWGGSSPRGFDCSGFVIYVYSNYYGVSFGSSRTAAAISVLGTAVSSSDIRVGDVVCYDYSGSGVVDHVALYIGNGQIVHASSRNSQVVQTNFSMSSVTTIRRFV